MKNFIALKPDSREDIVFLTEGFSFLVKADLESDIRSARIVHKN